MQFDCIKCKNVHNIDILKKDFLCEESKEMLCRLCFDAAHKGSCKQSSRFEAIKYKEKNRYVKSCPYCLAFSIRLGDFDGAFA